MDEPLLQLRGIGKNFGPVQALSGIDLDGNGNLHGCSLQFEAGRDGRGCVS